MEYNKSLSARIKRRNKCGFLGIGTHKRFISGNGDYTDLCQNHKITSKLINKRRSNVSRGNGYISVTNKYADNKQKVKNIVKKVFKKLKKSIYECLRELSATSI